MSIIKRELRNQKKNKNKYDFTLSGKGDGDIINIGQTTFLLNAFIPYITSLLKSKDKLHYNLSSFYIDKDYIKDLFKTEFKLFIKHENKKLNIAEYITEDVIDEMVEIILDQIKSYKVNQVIHNGFNTDNEKRIRNKSGDNYFKWLTRGNQKQQ